MATTRTTTTTTTTVTSDRSSRPRNDTENGLRERVSQPETQQSVRNRHVPTHAAPADFRWEHERVDQPHHDGMKPTYHWGLNPTAERRIFWILAISAWCLQIAAAVIGAVYRTSNPRFIGTMSAFLILHWAAWAQTVFGMLQRASWIRDEEDLGDRRTFLVLAVRLNRLMMPTALISMIVFIQAYVRRHQHHDLPYWLLFMLSFIVAVVFSVMNAYNNISWENTRLKEEGEIVYQHTRLAVLGIPS